MMKIFTKFRKKIEYKLYGISNKVKISSLGASLEAKYGIGVSIAYGTYIGKDVSIGDYTYVNHSSSIEKCSIGKYCSISSGVYINPYEHNYKRISTHPVAKGKEQEDIRSKVIIGNDVLISLNVIIKSGVIIGDGAVIGAGAVVTKDVMPYEIVGGVPAKHIKYRFDKDVIDRLLELKWWDWSRTKVEKELPSIGENDLKKGIFNCEPEIIR